MEFSTASMVGDSELDQDRGAGTPVTYNWASLSANSTNNTVTNSVSGSNSIAPDAFANANGAFSVIQNSGHNVIIQNNSIYNINFVE